MENKIDGRSAAEPKITLESLFLEARTHQGWLDQPVEDATLVKLYELLRMAPTSANCQPARITFVRGAEAKERLRPALSPGNVEKTMAAPVTAIVAYDEAFDEKLPKLFPQAPKIFASLSKEDRDWALLQNGSLQAAYLLIAARALGLDCGPMGGFDHEKVDAAFHQGTKWRAILLVNLGHGDSAKLFPRNPRLSFEEACRIV